MSRLAQRAWDIALQQLDRVVFPIQEDVRRDRSLVDKWNQTFGIVWDRKQHSCGVRRDGTLVGAVGRKRSYPGWTRRVGVRWECVRTHREREDARLHWLLAIND